MKLRIVSAVAKPGQPDKLWEKGAQGAQDGVRYVELEGNALAGSRPLTFNVYQNPGDQLLKLKFRDGQAVPQEVQVRSLDGENTERIYIHLDQKENFCRYLSDASQDIVEDISIPLEKRARAMVCILSLLGCDMFMKPEARNIVRYCENAARILFMARDDPRAIQALLQMTHADYSLHLHSINVGLYASAIALEFFKNSSQANFEDLIPAFFLHDIGKSRIAPEILNKRGPLLQEEWEEVKKHPLLGHNILDRDDMLTRESRVVVLQHHERLDGMGYPQALSGDAFHPFGRVCSIAEAFNALTTRRPYKMALPPFQALQVMKGEMQYQFDPEIFRILVLLMQEKERSGG